MKQLSWFILLWLASVTALACVSMLIRLVLF
ncbi:DUF2474 family protein [Vibrio ostreicida]|nr:DUF2474 family protein [Vibrio ostreicida]